MRSCAKESSVPRDTETGAESSLNALAGLASSSTPSGTGDGGFGGPTWNAVYACHSQLNPSHSIVRGSGVSATIRKSPAELAADRARSRRNAGQGKACQGLLVAAAKQTHSLIVKPR